MYFVTVSDLLGTNGERIARDVAAELGYGFFGREELYRKAEEMGYLSDVREIDEKGPPFFERYFSEKPLIHLDRLHSIIYEKAKAGNTVFYGRGSQLLLRVFDCALHVLATGSREKRISRVMEEYGVGKETAEKMVEQSDHDKRSFMRFAFDQDWLNPKLYHLILNNDKLSVPSAVRAIVDAAKSDEIKACGIDSVRKLGELALDRRIESAFLEEGLTKSRIFYEVEADDSVRLYGIATSSEERAKIEKILKETKGIKRVTNDLNIYSGAMGY